GGGIRIVLFHQIYSLLPDRLSSFIRLMQKDPLRINSLFIAGIQGKFKTMNFLLFIFKSFGILRLYQLKLRCIFAFLKLAKFIAVKKDRGLMILIKGKYQHAY